MWLAAARSGRTFLCLSSNNKLNAVACCTASLLAGVALVFPLHLAVPMCIHGSTLQQLCALPPTPHGPWWEGGKGLVLKPPGGGERTLFFVCLACVELKFVAISCPLPPLRELIFVLPHGGSRLTDTPPLLADARAGLAGCRIGGGLTSLPPPPPQKSGILGCFCQALPGEERWESFYKGELKNWLCQKAGASGGLTPVTWDV